MKNPKLTIVRIVLAGAVGGAVLMFGGPNAVESGGFTSTASARIGRPLTPMSYAGVARRTTRRTVAYGTAAYGAAAYGAAATAAAASAAATSGTQCVQAVDAYGRIYTRCY